MALFLGASKQHELQKIFFLSIKIATFAAPQGVPERESPRGLLLTNKVFEQMRICEITGKTAQVGNNVSHSNRKTKRRFSPNLKTKRFWLEEENRWVTLKVSTAGMKTINKKGLSAALKDAVAPKKVY